MAGSSYGIERASQGLRSRYHTHTHTHTQGEGERERSGVSKLWIVIECSRVTQQTASQLHNGLQDVSM